MSHIFKFSVLIALSFLLANVKLVEGLAFRAAGDGWRSCSKQTGYEDIDDVKDCRKFASDARKSFRKTESSSSSPKGCYLYRNQAVFYNFHSTGGGRSDETPICIKSKQQANTVNGNITALEKRIEALEKNQIGIMGKLLALDSNK